MTDTLTTPHDRFFKHALSDLSIAREFFVQHLPPEICAQLDLASLVLRPITFISKKLTKQEADVLFSINFKVDPQRPIYLYTLVEHQSTVDKAVAWRLLQYTVKIIEQHLKRNKDQTLPIVIPLVFYTGSQRYTAPLDIYELFGEHAAFARQVMFGAYRLIDLSKLADTELAKHHKTSVLQWVMKHVHQRDFMQLQAALADLLRNFFCAQVDSEDYAHMVSVIEYLLVAADIKREEQAAFFDIIDATLPSALRGEIMSLAQHLRQEGVQQGMQQGMQQGIQQGKLEGQYALLTELLQYKFGAAAQAYKFQIYQASESQLLVWTKKAINAQTLTDVFDHE